MQSKNSSKGILDEKLRAMVEVRDPSCRVSTTPPGSVGSKSRALTLVGASNERSSSSQSPSCSSSSRQRCKRLDRSALEAQLLARRELDGLRRPHSRWVCLLLPMSEKVRTRHRAKALHGAAKDDISQPHNRSRDEANKDDRRRHIIVRIV